jgi:hypothetical protein
MAKYKVNGKRYVNPQASIIAEKKAASGNRAHQAKKLRNKKG